MNPAICSSCGATLGWAEPDPCGSCNGVKRWNADATDRLYQVLCRFDVRPARVEDLHRVARTESQEGICNYAYALGTARIYLPQDARFCWAGRGIYGLRRDGLIAGPRNLAEVAVLVLCASPGPLSAARLEFVLKRMGYRFQLASLVNAMRRNGWFSQTWYGEWDVLRGQKPRREYRNSIDWRWPAGWFDKDMEALTLQVEELLRERDRLQKTAPDLRHLDDDWQPGK